MEYSPTKMQNLLEKNNFSFKKSFGQNFIIDENVINSIVTKADIDDDTLVLEIGPGAGSLTYKLAQVSKQLVCFEIDERLKDTLESNLSSFDNIDIIFNDFLSADIKSVLEKYEYKKLYVVANLPYYVTTPIIIKLIEDNILPNKIVVMVQKEVGNRFKALPKTKEYNSLSVFLNYYYDIKKIIDVSRNVFIPKPNVDSIVVEFNLKSSRYKLIDEKLFFKIVKDSFKQKRKTIRNNLKGYDLEVIKSVLEKHNVDLSVRAEALPLEVFVDISNELSNKHN
jgi:16S rRNA (adenine1518-N6/adenine1519-N6)-dimethyltransferase